MVGQAPIQNAPRTNLFGVDFSGAKDAGRRIWIAVGAVHDGSLIITHCYPAHELPGSGRERDRCIAALRELVISQEQAAFGFDFPFGLPQELIQGPTWEGFALAFPGRHPDPMSFRQRCRTAGYGRELKRRTDRETRTPFSPYNLRLYRQTYYGIAHLLNPLIRHQQASVLPMQEPHPERPWLLEICPASTLKREALSTPYKGRGRRAARGSILCALEDAGRLSIKSAAVRQAILDNRGGDALDSVIATDALFRALQRPEALLPAEPTYRLEGLVYV